MAPTPQTAVALGVVALGLLMPLHAQSPREFPLVSPDGLRLHHVSARAATLQGKTGVLIAESEDARRRRQSGTSAVGADAETLAVIQGLTFGNGTIEAELAGAVGPGAAQGARGFVGIAFRLQEDMKTYDAFYLRPTNGRADDQERRNHAAQYISHPDWPWDRLRHETPSRYEAYVDLVPNEWTRVKIVVDGIRARLFVHDQPQPTLIVNDIKTGAAARGAIALWIDAGTVAHFRNLRVTTSVP